MATIDELNFEVILDDSKFSATIQKDLKMAQELNTSLSQVLNMKKKLNKETTSQIINAEKVRQAEQKTQQEMAKTALAQEKVKIATEKAADAQRGHSSAVRETNATLLNTTSIMRTLTQLTGVYFGVAGVRRFLSSLIDITGQFEVQRMALRNMLQDVDGADKIFQDLYRFSSDSTYRFSELAKYAKQLAAFNIGKENLLETTKMLGDVASGVGVSMDRIILAYGHVKSSGFLRGIQLRSFAQNGVPILEELSKMFTEIEGKAVSLGDVFDKMTKREIPFEMVEEGFRRMTSEGGKFYQMQEVLAKTLAGQINILKGRWENMLAALGNSQDGLLKGVVGTLSNLVQDYEKLGNILREVILVWGVYRAGVIATTAATEGLTAATNVGLIGALKKVVLYAMNNPYALLAAGLTLYLVELHKYVNRLSEVEKIQQVVVNSQEKFRQAQAEETVELDRLYTKLRLAKEGTDDYGNAKNEILKRFGPYIEELRKEGVAVDNLASIYDNLAEKISNANKQRFLETTTKDITDEYGRAINDIQKDFEYTVNQIGKNLTTAEKEILWQYVRGAVDPMQTEMATLKGLVNKGGNYNGPYSGGTYNNTYTLKQLREQYSAASDAYVKGMEDAEEAFRVSAKATADNTKKDLKDWEQRVTNALDTVDKETAKKAGIELKENEDYYDYLERVGKEYKEINELKDKALKADKPMYEKWLAAIKEVDKALEGNILSDVRYQKTPWKGSGSSTKDDKARKDAISDLKTEVSLLEKYKAAYDKLQPYFGEDTANQLTKIFGEGPDYSDLDNQIDSLVGRLRTLGKEGEEAADIIEARLGTDVVSKILKSQKELETQQKKMAVWEKELRRWEKDWGGGFSGADNDIDAIIRKYNDEIKQIDDEYADALKKIEEAHAGNAEAIWNEKQKLNALMEARKKAAHNSAQESINDYSKQLVAEAKSKMDLTDWGDKSIGQVYRIWKDLKQKMNEAPITNEKLRDRIYEAGLVLSDFRKLTKAEWEELKEEAKEELLKKVGNVLKMFIGLVSDVAAELGELADATGNSELARFAEGFREAADVMGSVVQGFQKGGAIGAVIAGVGAVATKMIQAATEAARLNAQIREIREESRKMRYETMLSEGVDSIFGSNTLKGIDNAKKTLDEIKKAIRERQGSREGAFNVRTLAWMTAEIGKDLYDAYGNLNADSLQAILDKYPKLSQEGKEWIQQAINDSEAYVKAMKQLDAAVESIFGDIAQSAADTLVDQWIEAGNAALDYADILDDVAKSYSKMLIKSMIMDEVFNAENTEALRKAFLGGDYETAMSMAANLMQQVSDMAPAIQEVLQAFDPYYKREGETEVTASSKALSTNFSQDTIDYWSGQLTLLVEYARHGDEKMEAIIGITSAIRDSMGVGDGNYTANVQTYLASIQSDTSAIRSDIYSLKLAVQNMNDHGVVMR